ncbi:hypothetical protein ADK38_04280 [Streptomyces varsoviensis]|uniref:Dihydroxyacetone kinase n=1 Tax=Streptomyces varsoviensis TaxID=67373 RepID=A0ABR5JCX0_9ACTN|nr:hypothetical protein ADK38_04280 [Streptomyces varsoviensis]
MSVTLDTAFFRRFLARATQVFVAEAAHLTDLDAAIGDADHGANLKRGFTSAGRVIADEAPATPGALLTAVGMHLTNTVGGASGPLYGTVLRRMGKVLGEDPVVEPPALGKALTAAVASVRRLGDSAPGDATMVDALAPAAEAYTSALADGGDVVAALDAAARAAHQGAEATVPLQARRGRASYLGERSIGHQDPGAASSAMLITALYEATDTGLPEVFEGAEAEEEATSEGETAAAPATQSPQPAAGEKADVKKEPKENGRVGVVLVSHSRDVAASTADLAKALVLSLIGGLPDGGIGTSAELIRRAIADVDEGKGVVVLCDMGSAVLTVKEILADPAGNGVPEDLRIADAPFVEGAVAALVTASVGGDADMVTAATDDARGYRKV